MSNTKFELKEDTNNIDFEETDMPVTLGDLFVRDDLDGYEAYSIPSDVAHNLEGVEWHIDDMNYPTNHITFITYGDGELTAHTDATYSKEFHLTQINKKTVNLYKRIILHNFNTNESLNEDDNISFEELDGIPLSDYFKKDGVNTTYNLYNIPEDEIPNLIGKTISYSDEFYEIVSSEKLGGKIWLNLQSVYGNSDDDFDIPCTNISDNELEDMKDYLVLNDSEKPLNEDTESDISFEDTDTFLSHFTRDDIETPRGKFEAYTMTLEEAKKLVGKALYNIKTKMMWYINDAESESCDGEEKVTLRLSPYEHKDHPFLGINVTRFNTNNSILNLNDLIVVDNPDEITEDVDNNISFDDSIDYSNSLKKYFVRDDSTIDGEEYEAYSIPDDVAADFVGKTLWNNKYDLIFKVTDVNSNELMLNHSTALEDVVAFPLRFKNVPRHVYNHMENYIIVDESQINEDVDSDISFEETDELPIDSFGDALDLFSCKGKNLYNIIEKETGRKLKIFACFGSNELMAEYLDNEDETVEIIFDGPNKNTDKFMLKLKESINEDNNDISFEEIDGMTPLSNFVKVDSRGKYIFKHGDRLVGSTIIDSSNNEEYTVYKHGKIEKYNDSEYLVLRSNHLLYANPRLIFASNNKQTDDLLLDNGRSSLTEDVDSDISFESNYTPLSEFIEKGEDGVWHVINKEELIGHKIISIKELNKEDKDDYNWLVVLDVYRPDEGEDKNTMLNWDFLRGQMEDEMSDVIYDYSLRDHSYSCVICNKDKYASRWLVMDETVDTTQLRESEDSDITFDELNVEEHGKPLSEYFVEQGPDRYGDMMYRIPRDVVKSLVGKRLMFVGNEDIPVNLRDGIISKYTFSQGGNNDRIYLKSLINPSEAFKHFISNVDAEELENLKDYIVVDAEKKESLTEDENISFDEFDGGKSLGDYFVENGNTDEFGNKLYGIPRDTVRSLVGKRLIFNGTKKIDDCLKDVIFTRCYFHNDEGRLFFKPTRDDCRTLDYFSSYFSTNNVTEGEVNFISVFFVMDDTINEDDENISFDECDVEVLSDYFKEDQHDGYVTLPHYSMDLETAKSLIGKILTDMKQGLSFTITGVNTSRDNDDQHFFELTPCFETNDNRKFYRSISHINNIGYRNYSNIFITSKPPKTEELKEDVNSDIDFEETDFLVPIKNYLDDNEMCINKEDLIGKYLLGVSWHDETKMMNYGKIVNAENEPPYGLVVIFEGGDHLNVYLRNLDYLFIAPETSLSKLNIEQLNEDNNDDITFDEVDFTDLLKPLDDFINFNSNIMDNRFDTSKGGELIGNCLVQSFGHINSNFKNLGKITGVDRYRISYEYNGEKYCIRPYDRENYLDYLYVVPFEMLTQLNLIESSEIDMDSEAKLNEDDNNNIEFEEPEGEVITNFFTKNEDGTLGVKSELVGKKTYDLYFPEDGVQTIKSVACNNGEWYMVSVDENGYTWHLHLFDEGDKEFNHALERYMIVEGE